MRRGLAQDYLRAVRTLQEGRGRVSNAQLAKRLGFSPTSVTAMMKRLAARRLLDYEPVKGVRLTFAGEKATLRILERHDVLERFLTDVLGYPCDRASSDAERLEHAASDEFIEQLAGLLDRRETNAFTEGTTRSAAGVA